MGAHSCQQCPRDTSAPVRSNEATDCQCSLGFFASGSECAQCEPGKYKTIPGSAACVNCTEAQYGQPIDQLTTVAWQMCQPALGIVRLSAGVNNNISFAHNTASPGTLRALLSAITVGGWTVGDQVRQQQNEHRSVNSPVLRFIGHSAHQADTNTHLLWSPVNKRPIHTITAIYRIVVHNCPL